MERSGRGEKGAGGAGVARAMGWARRHPVLAAAGVLLVLLFLEFPGVVRMRQVPFVGEMVAGSDLLDFNYPMRQILHESVRQRHLPLWTDWVNLGFPAHAEGQGGFLYPPNLLLALLPLAPSICLSFLLTYLGAGVFLFLYAREIGQSRTGALFAAITFAFSGFLFAHIRHLNVIAAAQWVPLLLLLCERYARTRHWGWFAALAAVQALQHLAGHPQITYYGLLFTGSYLVARVLFWGKSTERVGDGLAPERGATLKPALIAAAGFAAAGALGAGLAGAQLLPTWELTGIAGRSAGRTYQDVTSYTLPPSDLLGFVAPFALGDPGEDTYPFFRGEGRNRQATLFWENHAYIGLLPLLLALAAGALLWRRNRHVALLAGLGLLSVGMALGKSTLLFYLAWRLVPGMGAFRVPSRFLFFADLTLAALAGFGLDLLRARVAERRPRWAAPALAALFLLTVADLLHCDARLYALVDARKWLAPAQAAQRIGTGADPGRVCTWRCADAWLTLIAHRHGWRHDPEGVYPTRNLLLPNDNVLQRVPHFEHYAGFSFAEKGLALGAVDGLLGKGDPASIRAALRFLGLYHVRWLATAETLNSAELRLAGTYPLPGSESGAVHLYENRGSLPRAYLAAHSEVIPRPRQAVGFLVRPGFDPLATVVLDQPPPEGFEDHVPPDGAKRGADVPVVPAERIAPAGEGIRWLENTPQRVALEVTAPRDCWLVLSDLPYPGWSVHVDGKLMPLYRANVIGRAVPVLAGRQRVVFRYESASWNLGVGISALSLAALLLAGLLCLREQKTRAPSHS